MKKILNFLKAHKIASAVAVVVILAGYGLYSKSHGATAKVQYVTQPAQKTTITVSITGTGQVSDQNKIDLKPSGSGALTSVNVQQGQNVKAGQTIAVVDERSNLVSLSQAKASLASAQANLDKLIAGATSEDVQVSKVSVDAAQQSLDAAKTSYNNVVLQQQTAVSNAKLTMLNSGLAAIPSLGNASTATVSVSGSYNGTDQGSDKITIGVTGSGFYYDVEGLDSQTGPVNRGIPTAIGTHGLYITFSTSGSFFANDSWTISIPNTQATSYLSNYNAYQSALQSQTIALSNAQSSVDNAQIGLEQAQAQLALKVAQASPQDVAAAQASVQTAQAQLLAAQVNYDGNVIKAPFDGQVAQLNNQVGDQVSSATAVATLITKQKLAEISLNEVDVSKIKVGDKAILTFDAIDGLQITGEVAQIDTIGTVSQGVVTYNVKIGFDTQDDRIKSGMSVSASIITDVKTDVIAVPNSAVKTDNSGNAYVQMLDSSGQPQNKTVQTGISNDTMTEITSGLNEGDSVVTQTINPSATSSAPQSNSSSFKLPGLGGGAGGAGANRVFLRGN